MHLYCHSHRPGPAHPPVLRLSKGCRCPDALAALRILSKLNEDMLREIADKGEGEYFKPLAALPALRCGFAAKTATSRLEAGATYYGVMEMTGNVFDEAAASGGVSCPQYRQGLVRRL